MNPIIVAATINVAGLIIVAIINLIERRSRNVPEVGHVPLEGEQPPRTLAGNTRGLGSGKSRAARRKAAGGRLQSITRTLRVVFFVGLLGSGLVWTYQRFVSDGSSPHISISTVPLAGSGGPDRIEPIRGTVTGAVPAGARVVVYTYAGGQWFVQPDTQFPLTDRKS